MPKRLRRQQCCASMVSSYSLRNSQGIVRASADYSSIRVFAKRIRCLILIKDSLLLYRFFFPLFRASLEFVQFVFSLFLLFRRRDFLMRWNELLLLRHPFLRLLFPLSRFSFLSNGSLFGLFAQKIFSTFDL